MIRLITLVVLTAVVSVGLLSLAGCSTANGFNSAEFEAAFKTYTY